MKAPVTSRPVFLNVISLLAGLCSVLAPVVWAEKSSAAAPSPEQLAFFESKVRPVLVEHCYKCHSAEAKEKKKLKADLFVDSREGLLTGGESGPAVVPG